MQGWRLHERGCHRARVLQTVARDLRKVLPEAPEGTQHPSPQTQHDRDTWPELQRYFNGLLCTASAIRMGTTLPAHRRLHVPVLTRDEAALAGVLPASNAEVVSDGNPVVPSLLLG